MLQMIIRSEEFFLEVVSSSGIVAKILLLYVSNLVYMYFYFIAYLQEAKAKFLIVNDCVRSLALPVCP